MHSTLTAALLGLAAAAAAPRSHAQSELITHPISTTEPSVAAIVAADIDDDGDTDVLSAASSSHLIRWYENDGAPFPNFTAHTIFANARGAASLAIADIDNDGDLDLLSAALLDHTIRWHENSGTTPPSFTTHVIFAGATGARSVFAADIDADNDIDVLSASFDDDAIRWYENSGTIPPSFTPRVIFAGADGARSVYAADIDADNDVDVLSASERDDTVRWYENDGASPPAFTAHAIFNAADGARSVFAADIDGDNDLDALSASFNDDTIRWHRNDTTARAAAQTFTTLELFNTTDGAAAIFAADLDRDADLDLLSASEHDDTIRWFVNDGLPAPTFTTHVVFDEADGALSVAAADVDGDLDPDVISASWLDGSVRWHENFATYRADDDAPPGGDGLSWATAFHTLQDALAAAGTNDTILVARGTYTPDAGAALTPGDQSLSFDLTGRTLRGGYAGIGATDPDARDPALHPSILSGDLSSDDAPDFQNTAENAFNILGGADFTLDGFEVTGAATTADGPHVGGGALFSNCHFHHNTAGRGGALFILGATIEDSLFEHNRALWDGIPDSGTGIGGALFVDGGATLSRCRLSRNSAVLGGAIGGDGGCTLQTCILTANTASHPTAWTAGGALFVIRPSEVRVFDSLIYANEAVNGDCGGICAFTPRLERSILWANSDRIGTPFNAQVTDNPVTNSATINIIQGAPPLSPDYPPVVFGDAPLFVDPLGPDGILGTEDDDFRPAFGSPAIDAGAVTNPALLDFRGLPRQVDDPATPNRPRPGTTPALTDIGPYEYQEDCDASGTVDSLELDNATLEDCNADGVPDLCQTFSDCNANTIPDECEIASGAAADCNANDVPDACDIALGTSLDANANTIPDECEPAVIFVNAGAPPRASTPDGASWPSAFTDLQDALSAARARFAHTEIWIAAGTYTPAPPGGPVSASFTLGPRTSLLGGFDGSETDAAQRDPVANPTTLSGDNDDDDDPADPSTLDDNAVTVLSAEGALESVIDGLTITAGHARPRDSPVTFTFSFAPDVSVPRQGDDTGAALAIAGGSLTIRDCRIVNSRADTAIVDLAGAQRTRFERCHLADNLLTGNAASSFIGHSGILSDPPRYESLRDYPGPATSLSLTDCTITRNSISGQLGSIISLLHTDLTLVRCHVHANSGADAVIEATLSTSPNSGLATTVSLDNSAIVANDGTALSLERNGFDTSRRHLFVRNATIAHNGAGIDVEQIFGEARNSIIFANDGLQVHPVFVFDSDLSIARHNTIQGFNTAHNNGTNIVANITTDPLFTDPLGPDATPRTGDEDFRLSPGSTSVDSGDPAAAPPGPAFDLARNHRFVDDPATPNTGPTTPFGPIDRGAWEHQAPQPLSPADVNGDRTIDITDFAILIANFATHVSPGTRGDLNRDAFVDVVDFTIFITHWPHR